MAVEAALVTPLLLILVFGIIEFAFVMRDNVAVSSAVRTGARTASAAADAGQGTCDGIPDAPTCTPQSSPALAQAAADAIQRAGSAMPSDSIDYILIYEANDKGYPGADGSTAMPASCAGVPNCVRFTWRDALDKFRYAGGSWPSAQINACINEADSLGVYMHATHKSLTGLFGDSFGISDHVVMSFEPLPHDTCKPGRLMAHP